MAGEQTIVRTPVSEVMANGAPPRAPRPQPTLEDVSEDEEKLLGSGEPISKLEQLLSYDSSQAISDKVPMDPMFPGEFFDITNLDGETHENIINRATKLKKNTGTNQIQRDLDGAMFQRLVVAYGVRDPNLRDRKIFKKYNMRPGQEDKMIKEIFKNYPGLVARLANAILELSGFQDQLVEVAKSADRD